MARYKFDFAFSFAGKDREIADKLYRLLAKSGAEVFYDKSFQSVLLGKDLQKEFDRIYGGLSKYVVIFVSKNYKAREYTEYEFHIAKKEWKKRKREYIIPLQLDGTKLLGLPSSISYIDLRKKSLEDAADLLLEKAHIRKIKRVLHNQWVATFRTGVYERYPEISREEVDAKFDEHSDEMINELLMTLDAGSNLFSTLLDARRDAEDFFVSVTFEWNPQESTPPDFAPTQALWELMELYPADLKAYNKML